jgi:hypothetical protein
MRPLLTHCALWYLLLAGLLIGTAHNAPSAAAAAALALCSAALLRASAAWNSDRRACPEFRTASLLQSWRSAACFLPCG